MKKHLQFINQFGMFCSLATLAFLLISVLLHRGFGIVFASGWINTCLLPVLVAGAIGCLPLYLLITLLFRPYHPIRWLGGLQGFFPSRQTMIAHTLGEEIPKKFLPPTDKLVQQLETAIGNYLRDPKRRENIRLRVNRYLEEHQADIADFLVNRIRSIAKTMAVKYLTAENLNSGYDRIIKSWLDQPENRRKLMNWGIVQLKASRPELTEFLRENVRNAVESYFREEHPYLSMLYIDRFAAGIVARIIQRLNWERIENKLAAFLKEQETQDKIFNGLTGRAHDFLDKKEFQLALNEFTAAALEKMEAPLRQWLRESLPSFVDSCFRQDELWVILEDRGIPATTSWLEQNLDKIITEMNLSGRIEEAVLRQDPKEVHAVMERISGGYLALLPIGGYIFGVVLGIVMILA